MDHEEDVPQVKRFGKQHNVLPLWGNEATMNLNPLILTNIQSSSYFKVTLFKLKTYHEVVDEIYYQVKHLEPWERGSRKTAGQTGMCGGVRGVGAGGIVSTAFCLLYKLYTLRLTRKQVNGLLGHTDSPYIRALGFMYIRFTQPPADLYDWYEDYLQDEEEIDVKAGGGQIMTIGQMLRQWLVKLDWFAILFPRIPVPIQKSIEKKLEEYSRKHNLDNRLTYAEKEMKRRRYEEEKEYYPEKGRGSSSRGEHCDRDRDANNGASSSSNSRREYSERNFERNYRSRSRERSRSRDRMSNRTGDRDKYRKEKRDKYREYNERDYNDRERDRNSYREYDYGDRNDKYKSDYRKYR